ncbi:hypothetical protein H2248_008717 [Termitomyces sp. 'cryptogamus']|nr:hypothetical protein H2248_008717 [Termitomyces sp. 'cryptogamus']
MSQLYICLYTTSCSDIYHWALALPSEPLTVPTPLYHITGNSNGWKRGTLSPLIIDQPLTANDSDTNTNFVCCVALPTLSDSSPESLNTIRKLLATHTVDQGHTPVISLRKDTGWACEQWVIRAIGELVDAGHLPDRFYKRHPKWGDLLFQNVSKAGTKVFHGYASKVTVVDGVSVVEYRADAEY